MALTPEQLEKLKQKAEQQNAQNTGRRSLKHIRKENPEPENRKFQTIVTFVLAALAVIIAILCFRLAYAYLTSDVTPEDAQTLIESDANDDTSYNEFSAVTGTVSDNKQTTSETDSDETDNTESSENTIAAETEGSDENSSDTEKIPSAASSEDGTVQISVPVSFSSTASDYLNAIMSNGGSVTWNNDETLTLSMTEEIKASVMNTLLSDIYTISGNTVSENEKVSAASPSSGGTYVTIHQTQGQTITEEEAQEIADKLLPAMMLYGYLSGSGQPNAAVLFYDNNGSVLYTIYYEES